MWRILVYLLQYKGVKGLVEPVMVVGNERVLLPLLLPWGWIASKSPHRITTESNLKSWK